MTSEHLPSIVTGLLRRDGLGLLVHRSPTRRWYPDRWDLPGGHVEDGEEPAAALRRELAEELGVGATVAGSAHSHAVGETFRMTMWVVDEWTGEPANLEPAEHDGIAWMSYQETTTLALAHPGLGRFLAESLPHGRRSGSVGP